MGSLYNGYQLTNSTRIPEFQGSVVPELMHVAGIQQQRYDTGQQQADLLDQAVNEASSSTFDKGELAKLKADARTNLKGYADKGNYEDMVRNIGIDGRKFMGKYKHIAANKQAIAKYWSDVDDAVEKGTISKEVGEARKQQQSLHYKGLKFDDKLGEYTNQFNGPANVKSVNYTEEIQKILTGLHAQKIDNTTGGLDGDYKIETSSGTERLPWESRYDKKGNMIQLGVKDMVAKGLKLNPAVVDSMRQDRELAPYGAGWRPDLTNQEIVDVLKKNPIMATDVQNQVLQGRSLQEGLKEVLANNKMRELGADIDMYSHKGIINNSSYSSKRDYNAVGVHNLTKDKEEMLQIGYSAPGGRETVSSATEFAGKSESAAETYKKAMQSYADFNSKNYSKAGGRIVRKSDGVDVTDEANQHRAEIQQAETAMKNYQSIDKAARADSGFKGIVDPAVIAESKKIYEDTKAELLRHPYIKKDGLPVKYTDKQIEEQAQAAKSLYISNQEKKAPMYAKYTEAIINRMNNEGETSVLYVPKGDKTLEAWDKAVTGMVSGLGLKKGAFPFTIGSGPDQGAQLSSDDYNELKGAIHVIGFDTDAKGQAVIKLRADKNVKGKKTEGADIVLNLGNTTVEDYMRKNMSRDEYIRFKQTAAVKGELSNPTAMAEFGLSDNPAIPPAKVRKSGNEWIVTVPDGTGQLAEKRATSYEGVSDIIIKTQALFNK